MRPARSLGKVSALCAIRGFPDDRCRAAADNGYMLDVNTLHAKDLKGLSKGAVTELAATLLAQLVTQQAALAAKDEHIARRDQEIKFKDRRSGPASPAADPAGPCSTGRGPHA